MDNKNKKTETGLISKWLKRLFSLEFLSVIIGLVGLWFAYNSFIQDKPGILRLTTVSGKLDEKITTVLYGFELNSDSIVVMNLPNIPLLANMTSNTIEDITVYGSTPKEYKVVPNPRYIAESPEVQKIKEMGLGKLNYGLSQDKIHPMDGIYWPVSIIYPDKNELLIYPIDIYYSYKTKKMTHIILLLVGIPNSRNSKTNDEIEKEFIAKIRPYLLDIKDLDKTAIIYNDKIVQFPSIKSIKKENVIITDIRDLK